MYLSDDRTMLEPRYVLQLLLLSPIAGSLVHLEPVVYRVDEVLSLFLLSARKMMGLLHLTVAVLEQSLRIRYSRVM